MLLRPHNSTNWETIRRLLVTNFVGNTCIALILWLAIPAIGRYGLLSSFVFSQCIGTAITFLSVLAGRLADRANLTRVVRTLLLVVVVIAGAGTGLALAHWIMGTPEPVHASTDAESALAILITVILASSFFYWFYSNKQKVLDLKLVASEQERRADNARHAMLRAQLNPHMLFNTLANLRALIQTDRDKALQMLDRLDSFLRETLDGSVGNGVHTLDQEFSILENYLSLMQIRLADRLKFNLDLPDHLRHATVPSLLLQPIVENSVRHGLEPLISGGSIDVTAAGEGQSLILTVRDNGTGMGEETRTGFGLSNLRDRLATMYSDRATVEVSNARPGCEVRITLPASQTQ